MILYWRYFFRGKRLELAVVVAPIVRYLYVLLLAAKPFVIGIASRDIRRQFWLALKCTKKRSALNLHGIEINPEKLRQRETAEAISSIAMSKDNQSHCEDDSQLSQPNSDTHYQ